MPFIRYKEKLNNPWGIRRLCDPKRFFKDHFRRDCLLANTSVRAVPRQSNENNFHNTFCYEKVMLRRKIMHLYEKNHMHNQSLYTKFFFISFCSKIEEKKKNIFHRIQSANEEYKLYG